MKTNLLQIIVAIIACIGISQSANCQTSANGLAVSAQASFLADTNAPQLFLTVHLLNTSTNDLVVLTKKLNTEFDLGDRKNWVCTIGYSRRVTFEGHLIIPPLTDFSPVTIRPNEEAIITQLVDQSMLLKHFKADTQLTIGYAISSEWGDRFKTWSGSAKSKPFIPTIKETK